MSTVTIIGAGNMGSAIAWRVVAGGNDAQVLTRQPVKVAIPGATHGTVGDPLAGDIVVLAVPFGAVAELLAQYEGQFDGKVLVDLTNPLDFETFDSLVVPVGSSAAEVIAQAVPGASVLKAFNTNFAATLTSGEVGGEPTSVLVAGDDADAKSALVSVVEAGGLRAVDAGSLKRAHELEALGFLQLTLAAAEKTSWTGGFGLTA
ncbi:NADPH-dependent F420 reductase [uncultured Cellulomonas sp.]|uniref:NADPH-dependent F420 reductase n=1 Tax=uncultured Cellulomonas sp. TaxID=189682 RepID=UPI0028E1B5A7|nr:NADPH-dependent F420 reductase [uncultured Cellulomonas sp.]